MTEHLNQRPRWHLPAYEVVLSSCRELRAKLRNTGQIVSIYSPTLVEGMLKSCKGKNIMPLPNVKCMYEEFVISTKFNWYDIKENTFMSSSNPENEQVKKIILSFQASLLNDCDILSPIHVDTDLFEKDNHKLMVVLDKYSLPIGKRLWRESMPVIKLDNSIIEPNDRIFSFYMSKLNAAYQSNTTANEFDNETKGVTPNTFA